jgi:hypothetical protein
VSAESRKRRRLARRAVHPIVSVNGVQMCSPNRVARIDLRDFAGGYVVKASSDRRKIVVLLSDEAREDRDRPAIDVRCVSAMPEQAHMPGRVTRARGRGNAVAVPSRGQKSARR